MDTDAVLALIQDVSAQVVDPRFRSLVEGEIAEKHPGDLVTVADQEAESLITAALQRAYPDAVILGEEANAVDDRLTERFLAAPHAFTVDPVDGTKNFVAGSPDHAVMVAEIRGGETVRGWIWQPQHRRAYVAERGAGAWRGDVRLVRPPVAAEPRGVTSLVPWVGTALDGLPPLELTWVCCGVDYPQLVEGAADYLVYGPGNAWDHAAGSLLVTEAGGFAGTFDGEPYRPQRGIPGGLVVAGDRATYDCVVPLVRRLGSATAPARPGLAPRRGRTGPSFELTVDGERFVVSPDGQGGTGYDWVSGPNQGYGFGSSAPFDSTLEAHTLAAREFLAMVDPATGYIGEEDRGR